MKKVRELLTYEQINSQIDSQITPDIKKVVQDYYKNLPKSFYFYHSFKFKLFLIITFWLIIPLLLYYFKQKKFNNEIISKIDLQNVYEKSINIIPELKFLKIKQPSKQDNYLKDYKTNKIPNDAKIVRKTNIKNFLLLNRYNVQYQTGLARWVRQYGKTTRVIYKTTGYILINNVNNYSNFNYSLHNHRILLSKEIKLENDDFNKNFNLTTNDKTQIRVLYTPYSMEKTIVQKELINLSWWTVEKKGNIILIRFQPKKWYDSEIHLNTIIHSDISSVEKQIINSITNSVYLLYKLLGLVLIPPFL